MRRLPIIFPILLGLIANCTNASDSPRTTATQTLTQPAPTYQNTPSSSSTQLPTPLPPLEPIKSIADVFPPRNLSNFHLDPRQLRVLVATGDIAPARYTDMMIRSRNNDFSYPFAAAKDLLAASDLTIVNLEAPLVQNCPPNDSGFKFCGRPGFATAMRAAKVDIATLENNHIADFGSAGITETIKYLDAAKISWADRQTPVIRDVRGIKFGFLAFNGVAETINRQQMVAQIKNLRPKADVLVIAMHWGAEYVTIPQIAPGIANNDPIAIAHLVIDAGADLIIGNHPHWVQPVEIYNGKFITYAHGNFIFDQMWSYETRVGVIGRYTFNDRVLVKVEYIPVLIENYAQPVLMQGKEAQAVLEQMRTSSEELARRKKTK